VNPALFPALALATEAGIFDDWMAMDYRLWVILGTYVVMTAVVFIWAAFFRKRGRRHRSHKPRHTPSPAADPPPERHHHGWWRLFRRRHRRRRRKSQRNPTLAEARGLPPVRPEEQPPTLP
jgi:hypothetical protein